MALFGEVFGTWLKENTVAEAELLHIVLERDAGSLQIKLHPKALLSYNSISGAERKLQEALHLQTVELLPRYEASQLTADYLPEVIAKLGAKGIPVNGFFTGATCDLLNGMMDSIDMVVAGQELNLISENGNLIKKYTKIYCDNVIDEPEEIARFIFNRYNDASAQHVWNCLYRRDVIVKNNIYFDEVYKYGMEDIMFNIEYAVQCRAIHKIKPIVYSYNRRIGISTSTRINPEAFNNFEYGLTKIRKIVKLDDIYKEQLYTLYAIRSVVHTYCKNNFTDSEKIVLNNFRDVYVYLTKNNLKLYIDNYFNTQDFVYYILDKAIRKKIYILFRLLRPFIK